MALLFRSSLLHALYFYSFGKHNAENTPHLGTCLTLGDGLVGVGTQTFPNNAWIRVFHFDSDEELENVAELSILHNQAVLTSNLAGLQCHTSPLGPNQRQRPLLAMCLVGGHRDKHESWRRQIFLLTRNSVQEVDNDVLRAMLHRLVDWRDLGEGVKTESNQTFCFEV